MKIKRLRIRNIASIESGDIDFEKGLVDMASGRNAPLFLITGDTGAGKTVILDAISMALYCKTPRIDSVEGVKNNEFITGEGESMKVNDIVQYTRLGIGPSDECYSEVTFEGNDGGEYVARLTLGMSRGRKGNGVSHRRPKWEVRKGDGDSVSGKTEVSGIISKAVGLTFEQFGRMAMLAQGQFAAFLTGEKKEREEILEQLTNTSKFSVYGQAIKNIFDRAKSAHSTAQTLYDAEKSHILTDDERTSLEEEEKSIDKEVGDCDVKIRKISDTLALLDSIDTADRQIADARRRIAELNVERETEEFKAGERLVAEWDSTTAERRELGRLMEAEKRKTVAEAVIPGYRDRFRRLSAMLCGRKRYADSLAEECKKLEQSIDANSPETAIFDMSAAITLKIRQYSKNLADIVSTDIKSKDETKLTPELKDNVERTTAARTAAAEALRIADEAVEKEKSNREALDPASINAALTKANERKGALDRLRKDFIHSFGYKEEAIQMEESVKEESVVLKDLKRKSDAAAAVYAAAKKEYDMSSRRLLAMKESVNDYMVALRHRLVETEADVCPLCGQALDTHALTDDFSRLLSPLEQEERSLEARMKEAEVSRDDVLKRYNNQNGKIEASRKSLAKLWTDYEKSHKKVMEIASGLGLDLGSDKVEVIDSAIDGETVRISGLKEKQDQAEAIQKKINGMLADRAALAGTLSEAEKVCNECNSRLDKNLLNVKAFADRLTELRNLAEQTRTGINDTIAEVFPQWEEDMEATIGRIESGAERLTKTRRSLSARREESARIIPVNESADSIRDGILKIHPTWMSLVDDGWQDGNADAAADWESGSKGDGEFISGWNALSADVMSADKAKREAGSVVEECMPVLERYYAASGSDRESLRNLAGREHEIKGARERVDAVKTGLASRLDAEKTAAAAKAKAVGSLGLSEGESLPDREALEMEKKALSAGRDELLVRKAAARTRLDTDTANRSRFAGLASDLESAKRIFEKWNRINARFGGTKFRTLVQSYILRPLLNNANIYLSQITDQYRLTCCDDNEQLSILVHDRYNKDQIRSATVLSGGERFMISLALSLALSSLNRSDMNVDILFIDEGFGTLDEKSLDSVMSTLERLQEIAGQTGRRVGVISHREELVERIPVKIRVAKSGEGRSRISIDGV